MLDREQRHPQASRLTLPKGYEVATGDVALLPWTAVAERLTRALTYWLATTRPDHRPHVTPLWGVWTDDALYFTGIPTARWAKNIALNPSATINLESGADVVILEGIVDDLPTIPEAALAARIVASWDAKYGRLHPDPAAAGMYCFHLRTARAWTQFPEDATRWHFAAV